MKKRLPLGWKPIALWLLLILAHPTVSAQGNAPNGCIFNATVTLTGSDTLCGGEIGFVSLAIEGGTAPYQVSLSDGTNEIVVQDYQSGQLIPVAPVSNTTYTINFITDATFCFAADTAGSTAITVLEPTTYYADADNDGFGDPGVTASSCSGAPSGFVANSLDCNDNQLLFEDLDGDGFGSEIFAACTGVPNSDDCDDNLIVYDDADFDGFGGDVFVPCLANGVLNSDDCDDNLLLYSDEDGDGFGSNTLVACGGVANTADCDDSLLYYLDVDNDGFGSDILAACDGEGVLNSDDCDDNLVLFEDLDGDGYGSEVFAACIGVPNSDDCDDTDESLALQGGTYYQDLDQDGTGNPEVYVYVCSQPPGYVLDGTDCDDADPDFSGGTTYYRDLDGDGYGDPLWPRGSCTGAPVGYVNNNLDCEDSNASINPGAVEIPFNLKDDDCDGLVDEGSVPVTTAINPIYCGVTQNSIQDYVYAALVAGAQGYQWRVTTLTGPDAGQVQIVNTRLRAFRLPMLATFAYGTTYKVEVAVRIGGVTHPYPEDTNCTVTTPFITTQLSNCNAVISSPREYIHAGIIRYAQGYRFRITDTNNSANMQEIDNQLRVFRLNDVTAFPIIPGNQYTVEVAVLNTDGTYLPYGNACTITTPFLGRQQAPAFDAVAYPNPFSSTVQIEVSLEERSSVSIRVYDLMGRMLEQYSDEVHHKGAFTLGETLPSGVYVIAIKAGDQNRTIRVVKR